MLRGSEVKFLFMLAECMPQSLCTCDLHGRDNLLVTVRDYVMPVMKSTVNRHGKGHFYVGLCLVVTWFT